MDAKMASLDSFTLEQSLDQLRLTEFTGEAVRKAFNDNDGGELMRWNLEAWVPLSERQAAIVLKSGTGAHPTGCTVTGFVWVE